VSALHRLCATAAALAVVLARAPAPAGAQALTGADVAAAARSEAQRRISLSPAAALEVYDAHVVFTRGHDLALLRDVARVLLDQIAADTSTPARVAALERLAAAGSDSARQTLGRLASGEHALEPSGLDADAALARLGDPRAVDRLVARLDDEGLRDKAVIVDALVSAKARRTAYALTAMLQDPNPFNRMAAARGLAVLGSREHVDPLRQALDTDSHGPIRPAYVFAIKSLGSASADADFARLEASPADDVRVQALEAYCWSNTPGWQAFARRLLQSSNDDVRLRAASLLGLDDAAARRELTSAAASPNLAVREVAVRLLEAAGVRDLERLAGWLHDPSPIVRAHAAGAVLTVPLPAR